MKDDWEDTVTADCYESADLWAGIIQPFSQLGLSAEDLYNNVRGNKGGLGTYTDNLLNSVEGAIIEQIDNMYNDHLDLRQYQILCEWDWYEDLRFKSEIAKVFIQRHFSFIWRKMENLTLTERFGPPREQIQFMYAVMRSEAINALKNQRNLFIYRYKDMAEKEVN